MYSIPVWRKCTLWLEYLPHLKDYSPHKLLTYRVCEEHFEVVNDSNMFSLVPSKNLPSKYSRVIHIFKSLINSVNKK